MKVCSRCKEEKDFSAFGKNKSAPDGKSYYCLDCTKAIREERKDKILYEGTKICTNCQQEKDVTLFAINVQNKDGRCNTCKSCHRSVYPHSEKVAKKLQQTQKQLIRLEKEMLISAYGGKCEICGDATFEHLTLDHRFGDGATDRKHRKYAGYLFYQDLRKRGYPKDNYRLLCWNCNCSLGFYKRSPIEEKNKILEQTQNTFGDGI